MSVDLGRPVVVLVEGQTDERLLASLLAHLQVSERVCVTQGRNASGKGAINTPLLKSVVAEYTLHERPLDALGIVADSDADANETFRHYRAVFANAGLTPPTAAGMVASGPPRTGVLAVPPGGPGELEDILWDYYRDRVPDLASCIDNAREAVEAVDPPARVKRSKILVHSAWVYGINRAPTVRPLRAPHQTFDQAFWDWSHPVFSPLSQFVADLLG